MNTALKMGGFLLVVTLSAGCNRPGCDGQEYSPQPHDPVITTMKLLGQGQDDPWTILLALGFDAPLGNLGNGQLLFYAGSEVPDVPRPLNSYFDAANVDLTATSGLISVPLTFTQVGFDYDAAVRLGTKVIDTDNRASNCYSMDLNFQLKLASP